MEIKKKDILICGGALFAIFFGAGNLIFPPHIGIIAGDRWWEVMIAFLLSDPLLPIWGVIVTAALGGKADDLGKRVGPRFAKVIGAIVILIIGPFFAVPRTGAVTYEILVKPNIPGIPLWIASAIFFAITLVIVLNPSKVIEIIGKYLTPILLVILGLIVGISIFNPTDPMVTTDATHLFKLGFTEGYQTMDAIGSPLMAGIVIADLIRRGYTDEKVQFKASIGIGIVAFILLALVYGGLTYAGATVGGHFDQNTERVALLIGMVELMLGSGGKLIMGIAVALACLTTSTGLISTCANFFDSISGGKLEYKKVAVVSTVVAFGISLLGVDQIIKIAVPILLAIYPGMIALIILSAFDKFIKYNWTYTGAVIGAYSISIIEAINVSSNMINGSNLFGGLVDIFKTFPLGAISFEWFVPAIVCSVVLTLISVISGVGKRRGDTL